MSSCMCFFAPLHCFKAKVSFCADSEKELSRIIEVNDKIMKCSIEFAHFCTQNTWKTNDFVDYFRNSAFLLKLPLKLSISRPSFLSVGSVVFESVKKSKIAKKSIILIPDLKVRF